MTVWFTVQLDDQPGSLARVAGALGERGVNITGIVGVAEDTDGALMLTTSDAGGDPRGLRRPGPAVRGARPDRRAGARSDVRRRPPPVARRLIAGSARLMRIATWNVNSLKARLDRVEEWLTIAGPDVLLMQETKLSDEAAPVMPFAMAGYELAHHGQGRWNGVAIASRVGIADVVTNFWRWTGRAGWRWRARLGSLPTSLRRWLGPRPG